MMGLWYDSRVIKSSTARRSLLLQDVGNHGFLTTRTGALHFGLPVRAVREITVPHKTATVGRAPAYVRGVMNLRGQVVALVDAALRMGLMSAPTAQQRLVILKVGSELPPELCKGLELEGFEDRLGLLVDTVLDVVVVNAYAVQEPPANLAGPGSRFVFGMVRMQNTAIGMIDPYELALGDV